MQKLFPKLQKSGCIFWKLENVWFFIEDIGELSIPLNSEYQNDNDRWFQICPKQMFRSLEGFLKILNVVSNLFFFWCLPDERNWVIVFVWFLVCILFGWGGRMSGVLDGNSVFQIDFDFWWRKSRVCKMNYLNYYILIMFAAAWNLATWRMFHWNRAVWRRLVRREHR